MTLPIKMTLWGLIALLSVGKLYAQAQKAPMQIQEQGSFAIGGTVLTNPGSYTSSLSPEGQTLHGDHGYVFYQKPPKPRKYPLVFLHGIFQFSKTWETTPDGREGFQTIFLRRGFSTYTLTTPRRGNAGRGTLAASIPALYDEQLWFNRFRVGIWPAYYPGVQFKHDQKTLDQYFRQMSPNIGSFDFNMVSDAVAATFDTLRGAILVSHSMGGLFSWMAVAKSPNVKAVVAWEPGGYYPWPNDLKPPVTDFDTVSYPKSSFPVIELVQQYGEYRIVTPDEFKKFTKIPIVIIYGDNIPAKPTGRGEVDEWGLRLQLARKWVAEVNKRGGDATLIHLPEMGIKGNTHFPFSDLNNVQMADLMSKWLKGKKLD